MSFVYFCGLKFSRTRIKFYVQIVKHPEDFLKITQVKTKRVL